ncbi:MAG: PAS domain-containing sensor histidine kinase [Acidobacteriota bacterium]
MISGKIVGKVDNIIRSLADVSQEAILVHNQGQILYVNEKGADFLGAPDTDSCIGKSILDFIHADDRSRVARRMEELTGEDQARFFLEEEHMVRADGKVYDIEWSAIPISFKGKPARKIIFRDISKRKRAEKELKDSRDEFRRLADHLQVIRELERAEISSEVHEDIGQLLAVLMMDLAWLKTRLPEKDSKLTERVDRMLMILHSAINSVRKITDRLRPALLDHLGLDAAIETEAKDFQDRTGIRCCVRIRRSEQKPDQGLSLAVFRIFQEALRNIKRHPNVSRVEVALRDTRNHLLLQVKDDAGPIEDFLSSREESLERLKMQERARSLCGEIKYHELKKGGNRLEAKFPLHSSLPPT